MEIPKELQPKIDELHARVAKASSPPERLEALIALADELSAVSPPDCESLLRDALALAVALSDKASQAKVESSLANLALLAGNLDAGEAHARGALALAREAGDGMREGSALSVLGILYRMRSDYERARECYLRCRDVSAKAGYPRGVQSAVNGLGNLAMLQGHLEEALECYQQCLELNEEVGDKYSGAVFHVNIGLVQEQLGRWEDAADNLYRAVAECERNGFGVLRYLALNVLGELFLKRDKLDRAIEALRLVAEAGKEKLTTQNVMRDALSNMGQAFCRRDDLASASRTFAEALELCRAAGDRREQAILLWRTAELALRLGRLDRAQTLAGESLGLARDLGLRTEEGEARRVLGLIEAGRGDADAARVAFDQALEALSVSDEGYELARARCHYARFLAEQGETRTAADLLRAASKVFRRLAVVAEAEEAIQLLFRLETALDRDMALLQAVSSLSALCLEPARFVNQCLLLLCQGLGFDSAALLAGARPKLVWGVPDTNRALEAARRTELVISDTTLSFPVRLQGHAIASIYLERRTPSAAACNTVIADTVGNLVATPVQLLIQTGAGTGGPAGLNFRGFTGTSAAVRAALQQAAGLAQSSAPVLIRGERGTGRKTLARAMHESGPHRTRRFVVFECAGTDDELLALLLFGAAGRPGRLDQDDIGTVFLEDIGCMSPVLQARLLDWLKTVAGPDKAGVVAACSRDLAGLVSRGEFRTELDDLLRKQELVMPPLRERREDIPGLIAFLVGQSDREFNRGVTGVSKDATERLMAGKWPGNIAELQRVIERAVLLADGPLVESDDLPAAVVEPQAAGLGS